MADAVVVALALHSPVHPRPQPDPELPAGDPGEPKPRSRKRTDAYLFRSMRTLRFLVIARAGRLTRLGGRNVLRLTENPATETLYGQIAHRLAA